MEPTIQIKCLNSLAVDFVQELVNRLGLKLEIVDGERDLLIEDQRLIEVTGDPENLERFARDCHKWVTLKQVTRASQVSTLNRLYDLF
jgi:hypothetical protein